MKTEKLSKDLSFRSRDSFVDFCNRFSDEKQFFFHDETDSSEFLTGKDLFDKVNRLGSVLQEKTEAQEKVLIVFPQGLEYIYSLIACFHANVIAIPVSVTDTTQTEILVDKIAAILQDCQATVLLTNSDIKKTLKENDTLCPVTILDSDFPERDDTENCTEREKNPGDIALWLYTSGSTSRPKEVVISHDSLMLQAKMAATQWVVESDSCIVSRVSQCHGFGLHAGVLVPLLRGASSIILSPGRFIDAPEDIFHYVDHYQATHIIAPDFTFDDCSSLIDISSVETFSLGSVKAIISAGEVNRKETHDNFMNRFRCLGLEENVFCPHYGLSETGPVSTRSPGTPLRYLSLDVASLAQHKVRHSTSGNSQQAVSCGVPEEGLTLKIVNPATGDICSADDVGEVWLQSASLCSGYTGHNDDTKSDSTINVDPVKDGFIRTGDLGFVDDNQLYIVGREKEVMILQGKNHHPVDVEWTIKNRVPQLTRALAVFSCDISGQEEVIVVQEMESQDSDIPYSAVAREILAAVSLAHDITLYDILLVRKGSIPKTGSGKVHRRLCRNHYRENNLTVLYQHHDQYRNESSGDSASPVSVGTTTVPPNDELVGRLKRDVFYPVLEIDFSKLEMASTFRELGIDSAQYVQISQKIEEVFDLLFQPVMLFKHSGFQTLADYLSMQTEHSEQAPESRKSSGNRGKNSRQDEQDEQTVFRPHHQNTSDGDVAIIGMSCHFPGGSVDPDAFWENLVNGNDCISPVSDSRPGINDFFRKNYGEQSVSLPQWGGFIEDVDCFDAGFFGLSAPEAESMDPQQRKALELTWSVIESAGYNPRQLAGDDVGLFIGVHNVDYAELVASQPALMETYGAFLDSGLPISMISNRVSRWFDFHGPSEVINTACSDSLVAIHHAVESLRQGDSRVAIAGGINVLLAPRVYLACENAAMLSEDGRCKTFDENANGFVRAEGYGAVLLKPYEQALKDNDTVYGIIRGASIHHDGQSGSFSTPGLSAQKRLIHSAYDNADIAPETINYIEVHGTGTPSGDSVEVQALSEAFQDITPGIAHHFCGLGAVKTNIGHCESAAGIASLIKVLLAMKHQTLPGVLHFRDLSPHIALDEKPFYVVEQTQEWQRLKNSEGEDIPRRAGISSFGFGGTNAHLIIEEHQSSRQPEAGSADNSGPALVIFSAHHPESLHTVAENFLAFVNKSLAVSETINVSDMAYTLQVGREAMDERVAFLADDLPALAKKLTAFLQGEKDIDYCWTGSVKEESSRALLLFDNDEDSKELVYQWAIKGKLEKIAQLWVQGCAIDWHVLHRPVTPKRIGLPTCAFVKKRYWIPGNDGLPDETALPTNTAVLHPLLHTNTSDFVGQRFSTNFSGKEVFFADHVVRGQRVLPGVAQIEMAIAAVRHSLEPAGQGSGLQLKDIVWVHPVIATNTSVSLHISLRPEAQDDISYDIYSLSDNTSDADTVIHSQGRITLHPAIPPVLDMAALQSNVDSATSAQHISARQCYQAFADMGIHYGPVFRGVEELFVSPGQVLAKLSLPESARDPQDRFTLSPGLLEAVLQATIGFSLAARQTGSAADLDPGFPFALDVLELFGPCPGQLWARICRDEKQDNNSVNTLDIDLYDSQGRICVRMTGLSLRALPERTGMANTGTQRITETGLRGRSRYIPGEQQKPGPLDIAIIGISGRYPQARNLDEFWVNLRDGKNCITEGAEERRDDSQYVGEDKNQYVNEDKNKFGKTDSQRRGVLDGVDEFDPLFFNISPEEAGLMDPQERLFLECVFEVMEDAGYTRDTLGVQQATNLKCDVGVYAGAMYNGYRPDAGVRQTVQGKPFAISGSASSIASRVSCYFDFRGPCMAIDTMCSSSLTAIHLACQGLQHEECGIAIAGGVHVSACPDNSVLLGRDDYVSGEGVGAVLLKPAARAIEDGDNIYGIIKAAAISHGGNANGCTAPDPDVQADVIAQVFEKAGIDPRRVSYIDACGAGASPEDSTEIAGLKKAFETYTTDKQFCAIGSVKSGIGYCESAAGIAAVTKILLQLKHKKLVPSLPSGKSGDNIDVEDSPFVIQQQLADWERPLLDQQEYPRLAAVSSFGAGGSNAHVLVEEYVPDDPESFHDVAKSGSPVIIILSAANEDQLKEQTKRLLNDIQQKDFSDSGLRNIAFSLQVGREAMEERLAIVASTAGELEEMLTACMEGQANIDNVYRGQVARNREILAIFSADDDMEKTIDSWVKKGKFEKLLSLWVKGLVVDWNKLYGDVRPRRISLPTYPFARERYRISGSDERMNSEEAAPARTGIKPVESRPDLPDRVPDTELTVDKATAAEKNNHKPVEIVLADPLLPLTDASVSPVVEQHDTHAPDVLSDLPEPLSVSASERRSSEVVEQHEHDKGIFEVRINDIKNNNLLSKQILHDLHESFGEICRNKKSKVILLTGQDKCFLSSSAKQQDEFIQEELGRLITECEIPVIAVMKGDATGMGWLAGILCDFMVFSEESVYRYHPDGSDRMPETLEQLFVSKRLGKEIALHLLYSNEQHAGRELKEKGMRLPVLPKKELDSYVMKMACELAESSREALLQLKKHRGSERKSLEEVVCPD